MATTVDSNSVAPFGWSVNCRSDDLTGTEELKAAVTGKSHYVESLYVSSGAAITVTIGAGKNAGALATVLCGPFYLAANTNTGLITFSRPIKLAAATALCVDASGAGNCCIIATGYSE